MFTLKKAPFLAIAICCVGIQLSSCQSSTKQTTENTQSTQDTSVTPRDLNNPKPLISEIYTADPSAHVFNGKIYIYPSHDIEANVPEDDEGGHFNMKDYHVLSMDNIDAKVVDNGVALDIKDVPWAGRQMWAPDAAYKNGTYYLYFPVKDKEDVFRMGVATSKSPTGPFKAEPAPIPGSFSIDPAVFTDTDGKTYMYFGGIWGGQLQRWHTGKYDKSLKTDLQKDKEPALSPKIALLSNDMLTFDGPVKDIQIVDSLGKPLLGGDHDRRFFEGAWMHKYKDTYYFSYSTGDTHFLAYATSKSPYGPFTYQDTFMKPVSGWTTHHSIVEFNGKWYIFYHDVELSGKTHLRNVKVRELKRKDDGAIELITP